MTFQCTLNTRLKKIVVVTAKSKQYSPFPYVACGLMDTKTNLMTMVKTFSE